MTREELVRLWFHLYPSSPSVGKQVVEYAREAVRRTLDQILNPVVPPLNVRIRNARDKVA